MMGGQRKRMRDAAGWALSAIAALLGLMALLLLALMLANAAQAQGTAQTAPATPAAPHVAARYKLLLLREAHGQWGLGAPVPALAAQVHQESGWRPDAVSRVGARGMAQFMPSTARWWCAREAIAQADCLPHNPAWALRAMVG